MKKMPLQVELPDSKDKDLGTREAMPQPSPRAGSSLKELRLDGFLPGLTGKASALEEARIQMAVEEKLINELQANRKIFHLSDVVPLVAQGASVIVQDDFSRCFTSEERQPWNWNAYLYVVWCLGVLVRYGILFPIRLASLLCGFGLFLTSFALLPHVVRDCKRRAYYERKLIRFVCGVFVFSWTGVIKYHGTIPTKRPNQVYVANHTSMIDMIILQQMHTFSLVGQKHPGWVGFLQDRVLASLGCVWFDRGETQARTATSDKIKAHVSNPDSNRLLLFPEGTCVNNYYCVQFKKGVFEMGAEICPIAIKYNKIFADAFWNSRAQSFAMHLVTLMTSWAVVCDVWYLDPQRARAGESGVEFSDRVKKMIADKAGLRNVQWDGYLKHYKPSARYVQERQKMFAQSLKQRFNTPLPSPVPDTRTLGLTITVTKDKDQDKDSNLKAEGVSESEFSQPQLRDQGEETKVQPQTQTHTQPDRSQVLEPVQEDVNELEDDREEEHSQQSEELLRQRKLNLQADRQSSSSA